MLNGLDLFSGIGGLTLALGEWVRPVAYCEKERYAQGVLLSRMAAGDIPTAPVWDDVTTLDGAPWRGVIDIIYGGFPCQDISVAGHGAGLDGKRSGLFFEIVRLAEEIFPPFIFLENVPAIRTRGLDRVGQELASLGYDCRWGVISAYDVGAPHKRERWFLLANATGVGRQPRRTESEGQQGTAGTASSGTAGTYEWPAEPRVGRVAHGVSDWLDAVDFKPCLAKMRSYAVSTSQNPSKALRALRKDDGAPKVHQWRTRGPFNVCEKAVLLPFLRRLERLYSQEYDAQAGSEVSQGIVRGVRDRQGAASTPYRPKPTQQRGGKYSDSLQELSRFLALYCAENWQKNRGAHAIHRVERLRGLGNAVVPAQAREAFKRLMELDL